MELIDKSAVVAEVTRLKVQYDCGWNCALDKVLDHIDDLEVKDIDLEGEITDYINKHYHISYDETLEMGNDPLTTLDFEEIAKHFFELGLKAQKGE